MTGQFELNTKCVLFDNFETWRSWWGSCPCKNKCTVVHSYLWKIGGHVYERL